MNPQMKKTFKSLKDRKVAIAFNTNQPVPHTNGHGIYLMTGVLKEVGEESFIIQLQNKERLYGSLDDIYYFSDIELVKHENETTDGHPPSVKAPALSDS